MILYDVLDCTVLTKIILIEIKTESLPLTIIRDLILLICFDK